LFEYETMVLKCGPKGSNKWDSGGGRRYCSARGEIQRTLQD